MPTKKPQIRVVGVTSTQVAFWLGYPMALLGIRAKKPMLKLAKKEGSP
jgi:hypothetical protein